MGKRTFPTGAFVPDDPAPPDDPMSPVVPADSDESDLRAEVERLKAQLAQVEADARAGVKPPYRMSEFETRQMPTRGKPVRRNMPLGFWDDAVENGG